MILYLFNTYLITDIRILYIWIEIKLRNKTIAHSLGKKNNYFYEAKTKKN